MRDNGKSIVSFDRILPFQLYGYWNWMAAGCWLEKWSVSSCFFLCCWISSIPITHKIHEWNTQMLSSIFIEIGDRSWTLQRFPSLVASGRWTPWTRIQLHLHWHHLNWKDIHKNPMSDYIFSDFNRNVNILEHWDHCAVCIFLVRGWWLSGWFTKM